MFVARSEFINYLSNYITFKTCLRHRSYCRWAWLCIFCRLIGADSYRLNYGLQFIVHLLPCSLLIGRHNENKKHFQIICQSTDCLQSVTTSELMSPGCGRAYFVAQSELLRRSVIGITQCGHYASVSQRNFTNQKASSNNLSTNRAVVTDDVSCRTKEKWNQVMKLRTEGSQCRWQITVYVLAMGGIFSTELQSKNES